jgi:hypothetical protein
MELLQRHIVQDHIHDLRREADARRTAQLADGHDERSDEDVGIALRPHAHRASPVRVRFGHWLIGLGAAVAGSDDRVDGAARRAA